MSFQQERSHASNTFGTYNDVQGNQYNMVVNQSQTVGTPAPPSDAAPRYLHKHMLPSPPELMIGRDKEKEDIINTLLHKSPARLAILGGGGMGKTTLVLSILYEDAIAGQYPSRYFVSCEGVLSISSLIEGIANALRIPPAKRDAFLINTIFSTFPKTTLLCLDNFETLWDNEAIRPEIEEFLSLLQHQVQGLMITMRGAQRPSRVSWSKPFLAPLQPLTEDVSRQIFKEMNGDPVDEFVEKLLVAVDGIPLAISLISTLLQDGFESSESLWSRWETQSGVLERGGKHRLSNLDTSIHLSVYGPRMREDPATIDILSMLSVLPDGLPDDEKVVEELQRHLPEVYHLQKALLTMRRVSLLQVVQVDGVTVRRRLRMLSPIQSFCQRMLEGSEELRDSITSFYVQKMDRFANFTNPDGHAIIPNELHNVRAVLMQAWRGGKGNASIAVASVQFTSWSVYLGNPVEEVVRAALQGVVGQPNLQGRCHGVLGEVYLQQNKLDEAERSFKCAVELYQQSHSVVGEGHILRNLGEVHLRRSELDEAETLFKRAAELHQQARDVLGEGNDLRQLGEVHIQQLKLNEAEASFKRAIELHRQASDILGEGNDLQKLGDVYLRRSKLDEAEASVIRAAELHRQAHDVLGEGNDLRKLGEVHLRRFKLDEAEATFEHAIELHKRACDIIGEANDLQKLGEAHLRRSKLGEAKTSFKRAAELHRQARDVLGEANDVQKLGEVYLRRSKLDKAEASFTRAAELHRQAHSVLGEGNVLRKLGEVHLRRSELDEAEISFKRAIILHQQVRDVLGEGNNLSNLGEVYLRRSELDEAESLFKRAAELHKRASNVLGEGNDIHKLGEVYLRQSKLDEAEESFKRAAELHQQVRYVVGEGYDFQMLGKVHLEQNRLDEAEASFKHAAELHRRADNVVGEGRVLQNMREVDLRRSKLEEAEVPLRLEPDVKAHFVQGEASAVLEQRQGATVFQRQIHSALGDAKNILTNGDMDGNTPPRLGPIPAQNRKPSQNKPMKLSFRKRLLALFSSCYK